MRRGDGSQGPNVNAAVRIHCWADVPRGRPGVPCAIRRYNRVVEIVSRRIPQPFVPVAAQAKGGEQSLEAKLKTSLSLAAKTFTPSSPSKVISGRPYRLHREGQAGTIFLQMNPIVPCVATLRCRARPVPRKASPSAPRRLSSGPRPGTRPPTSHRRRRQRCSSPGERRPPRWARRGSMADADISDMGSNAPRESPAPA